MRSERLQSVRRSISIPAVPFEQFLASLPPTFDLLRRIDPNKTYRIPELAEVTHLKRDVLRDLFSMYDGPLVHCKPRPRVQTYRTIFITGKCAVYVLWDNMTRTGGAR